MAFCIDPFTKTVTPWQPAGAFLPALRETIGCTQLDSVMVQPKIAAFVDNFGMLVPGQRFWRFKESPYPFAGKVIMTGVDPDGMPTDAGPQDLAAIAANLDWCEGLAVVAIREELRVTPTEEGPWPRIVRITEFNRPVVPENAPSGPYVVAPSSVAPEMPNAPAGPPDGMLEPSPHVLETLDIAMGQETPTETVEPLMLWIVVSDDSTDKFVAAESDLATGRVTGRKHTFDDMTGVVTWFAAHDAERWEDDAELPDEVVARFVMPGA